MVFTKQDAQLREPEQQEVLAPQEDNVMLSRAAKNLIIQASGMIVQEEAEESITAKVQEGRAKATAIGQTKDLAS
jgi:hypothetical protein